MGQDASQPVTAEQEGVLLGRARAGDARAFCDLVRLHQARTRRYIAFYIARSDVVDDLAQDVFLCAYRKVSEYAGEPGFFHTWLLGIARLRVLDHVRTEARRSDRRLRSLQGLLDQARVRWVESENDQVARRDRELEGLRRCMDLLPAESSDLVTQHYFGARALADIAARLAKKESAVRMALLRIRRMLRQCVERRIAEQGV